MMQCLCPCMRAGTNAESSNLLEAPSADQFAPLEDAKLLGGGATPGSVAANAMKRGAWLDEADDLASQCFICGVEFGVLVDSRHHCRRCGNTFCAKCSQGRAPLLLYGVKTPERLCDACYPETQGDNEFATRHLPRLTRGTTGACRPSAFSLSAESVLVRLTAKGDAVVVLGKDAAPLRTVPLADVRAVEEPGAACGLVVRCATDGALSPGLRLELANPRERECLADALRAAARRSKAPDLAASVEKDRARQKLERRRAMSIRDRMESAEQRRKSNSKLRDNLRDKYALPKK